MVTTLVCRVESCNEFALFLTRTKPAWCETYLGDIYDRAGLRLLELFTKLRESLFTRCTSCGFEGHYRFEYVLQSVGRHRRLAKHAIGEGGLVRRVHDYTKRCS